MSDTYQLLLSDIAKEPVALSAAAKYRSDADDAFASGRAFGLFEAIDLIATQADAFGVDRSSIGLGGVDPDRDLLK